MPLDPHLQGMLRLAEALGAPSLRAGTPGDARRLLRTLTVDVRPLDADVPVRSVRERIVRVDRRRLRLRIYRPMGRRSDQRPTVAFFHGGGFVIGDLDTHDLSCRLLCRELDAVVVSVDYRLAPEHPFPAALEDALAATRWTAARAGRLGGDPSRLVVAGDSAGGNLAAVVAQQWSSGAGPRLPPLAAQLLIYPVIDLEDEGGVRYPSRRAYAEGHLLTGDDMRWFAELYVGEVADRRDPRLSPIRGDLVGLPSAVVVTAEFDPLRDEGEAYAAALAAAGVPVAHHRFDGLIHGFFGLAAWSPACAAAVAVTCRLLRGMLARERT